MLRYLLTQFNNMLGVANQLIEDVGQSCGRSVTNEEGKQFVSVQKFESENDLPATTMSWESPLSIFISFSVGLESLYGPNNVDMMSGVVVIS